jgi:jumonji domain-containing protein 2
LFFSNPVLPQSFLEAPKKNPKRHPIHKKKGPGTAAGEDVLPSIDRADEEELDEIPPDVRKVLEEMALEEDEPDEDTLEVLEDIWLKAGEIGKFISLLEMSLILFMHIIDKHFDCY